jgi:MFS family permease
MSTNLKPHYSNNRRNFLLGILNGVIFKITMLLIDSQTVLTWFLIQLGVSNFYIGLISPIRMGSSFLLQIFVSGYLQQKPYKLPFYRTMAVLRCGALLVIALAVALIPLESPWLIIIFFAVLAFHSMGSGLNGLAFIDIVAKVIPTTRRGHFFAQRAFWGGLVALITGPVIGFLLSEACGIRFPINVAWLFGAAFLTQVLASALWLMVKEPPGEVITEPVDWIKQLKQGGQLLRDNVPYRMYLLTQLCRVLADTAGAFYIVYAKEVLGISAQMVGVYLTARTAASIGSNLLWGRVSDRMGNRRLLQIANALGLCVPLIALGLGLLGNRIPTAIPELAWAYALVFVVSGTFVAAANIARNGYLLDLAPPVQRPLYMGFSNTLRGIFQFVALASGLIVDWAGFPVLMAVSACFYGLALVLTLTMPEPRTIKRSSILAAKAAINPSINQ